MYLYLCDSLPVRLSVSISSVVIMCTCLLVMWCVLHAYVYVCARGSLRMFLSVKLCVCVILCVCVCIYLSICVLLRWCACERLLEASDYWNDMSKKTTTKNNNQDVFLYSSKTNADQQSST